MSRLGRLLRSRRDHIAFQVTSEWPIALSAAGVILGAVTILPSGAAIVLGVIAFVVGLGAFVHDLRQLRRRWSDYQFRFIAAPLSSASIPPPPSYPDPIYLYIPGDNRGTSLISDTIDRSIIENELAADVDEEPYHLPKSLKASARYVLPVISRGRLIFNGLVVGMHGDPLPPGRYPAPPIRLHVARYFDDQCSNEMCRLRITNMGTDEEFDPRRQLLTSATGHLNSLSESPLADVIGISTVAVTTDNHIVVGKQTHRNVGSPSLLAPSGSGSLHPDDIGESRKQILQDIVRRGMERELREETGIRSAEIRGTAVVGFARWLDRGARPEFYGWTELSVTAEELARPRRVEVGETLYSDGFITMKIDIGALGHEIAHGTELLDAASLPVKLKEEGSVPLLLALRAAALSRPKAGQIF